MARFRKKTIEPGGYQTPEGAQVVDPARLAHWADTVREMRGLGIKPPLSWGHAPSALPHSADDAAFWASRLVAGEVIDMTVDDDGRLAITGDAPGVEMDEQGRLTTWTKLPDGREVKGAIAEVSIGAMDWTDGTGRLWKDAPVHVALTPLPVWVPEGGQPPFEKVEDSQPKVAHFGTASLLYRFATPGGPDVAEEEDKKDDAPGDGDGADQVPEVGFPEVLEALAQLRLYLPESTTPETLWRDIVVGAAAIAGANGDADNDGIDDADEMAAPPAEAGGGAFMSTLRNDPIGLGLIAELEKDQREKRLARVAALKARGLPVHQANKLVEQITAVRFSTDTKGVPIRPAVDGLLDWAESLLPEDGESNPHRALFGTYTPTPPEGDEATAKKRDEDAADQLARAGGLPARKRGA